MELKELLSKFQVLHDFMEVMGISQKGHHLNSISKQLSALRADATDYLVAEGLAIPKPPLWGKDNNLTKWWSTNDFKIVAPYLPKAQDLDNDGFPEIHTPIGKSALPSSVTELPPSWKFKFTQEEPHNCFHLLPLSTVTSGRNLARLISNKPTNSSEKERDSIYPPRTPWNNQDDSKNPF